MVIQYLLVYSRRWQQGIVGFHVHTIQKSALLQESAELSWETPKRTERVTDEKVMAAQCVLSFTPHNPKKKKKKSLQKKILKP